MDTQPIVVLDRVSKHYHTAGRSVQVFKDLTFSINTGEIFLVTGPSGSGKTTLLNLIGGLDRPTDGSIAVQGRFLANLSSLELARFRNSTVGFVFQFFNLIPFLNALDNVKVPMVISGQLTAAEATRRARELLRRVEMDHREAHYPPELSGGEQQRVAIARALANRPPLILADEPTGNLDEQVATKIIGVLVSLQQNEGLTLVVASHNPHLLDAPCRRFELPGLARPKSSTGGFPR
ncbi:MAG: hypothetical protein DRN07_05265 [Thermoplasmata archaeon]|nr:MAG: hypothetical protein DRN07_05265 [Thermoplasmata archaeon]